MEANLSQPVDRHEQHVDIWGYNVVLSKRPGSTVAAEVGAIAEQTSHDREKTQETFPAAKASTVAGYLRICRAESKP